MSRTNRTKQVVVAGAAAVGLALGVATLAGAATTPQRQAEHRAAEQDQAQDPMLNGSIQAPEGRGSQSEEDEAKALEALATVTRAEAEQAAKVVVPGGAVIEVELENENGSVVYSVEMTDAGGAEVDVKVDAGNGEVLHQDRDSDDGDEADEGSDDEGQADEGPGSDEAPEDAPAG